ncbi:shikimate kinase [Endozoicomonas sp. OPT23]|uniref:shikimate kinase n=1 Tax=Endozoicomonas sp. OPT23 TaxID=2072845 RepID=UPI00129B7B9C|nr:shikimate kinase [Endozoicomonas sp. OPT23]MRI32317.1 shikimate kinase [Endozoicomonas sp. OPT23]
MKTNITLIGMPGAGKSTIGIILAKDMAYGFVDTDVLIQISRQKTLQDILDKSGYMKLREIEEEELLKVNLQHHIIATGGSAVYSDAAMKHLSKESVIVFLDLDLDQIRDRIHNFDTRGIARSDDQTIEDLFEERVSLYKKYSDITINCRELHQDELALDIMKKVMPLLN